jgi:hypothetical protein
MHDSAGQNAPGLGPDTSEKQPGEDILHTVPPTEVEPAAEVIHRVKGVDEAEKQRRNEQPQPKLESHQTKGASNRLIHPRLNIPAKKDFFAESSAEEYLEPATKEFPMVATQDIGQLAAKTLLESWKGNRVLELEGPKRYSPLEAGKAFSKILGMEVNVRPIPRSQWQEKFVAEGMPADCTGARIEMVEGFNSGWIDFEGDGVKRFKGKVTIEEVIKSLIAKNSAPA